MNYYMPYFNLYPNMVAPAAGAASRGLFSRLLGGLNWGTILNTTQRTLGVVNQAIPVIRQVTPVMKNAKTIFKVMNEFKRVDTPTTDDNNFTSTSIKTTDNSVPTINDNTINFDGSPTFFVN